MENYKKHILILTPGFPKDENDDNCIPPFQIFLENFKGTYDDWKISVVTLHYPKNKLKYDWHNIDVFTCGGNDASFPKRFKFWKEAISYAKKITEEFPISLVHSFWLGECALLGSVISNRYKIPHINTLMGQELNNSNKYLKFITLKKMKVIALSERQALIFKNKTRREVDEIIPWGVRANEINANEMRDIDIIGVGSLTSLKNFELFIEVLNEVKKNFPDIRAVIIGDGIEKEKLNQSIENFGLMKNLKLLGNLKRQEVLNLMSRSKILLHTSKFESFGYALAEALANGCYVICSSTGFAQRTKKMHLANEGKEFVKIIIDLMNNKPDYNPEIPFALDKTSAMYNVLYNQIAKGLLKSSA